MSEALAFDDPVADFRCAAAAAFPTADAAYFTSGPDGRLAAVTFSFLSADDWRTTRDGTCLPAGRVETSLRALGWSVATGLNGPVRDDVQSVIIQQPGPSSPAALWSVWAAALAAHAVLAPDVARTVTL